MFMSFEWEPFSEGGGNLLFVIFSNPGGGWHRPTPRATTGPSPAALLEPPLSMFDGMQKVVISLVFNYIDITNSIFC